MAQGITGTILVSQPSEIGLFQGRLDYATTTTVKLNPKGGRYVEVDGYLMDIAASLTLATTDNRIDSTGANAAAALTLSTLYYVYVGNSVASYGPGSLRASTVAPTLLDGVKYLGTTGNARNWRFVGYIRTNGSTQFTDSVTSRLVVSYYNRKLAGLFSCPAYADGNTQTIYTTASTTWVAANGGTGSQVIFISNGEDVTRFGVFAWCYHSVAGSLAQIGLGLNTTTGAKVQASVQSYAAGVGAIGVGKVYSEVMAEGVNTADLVMRASGATATFNADDVRNGSATDPYATYIEAEVMI